MDDSIDELTKLIVNLKTDKQSLESSLLEEQSQKLKLIKDPKVRKIILDDVKELITCYEHGAYKATLTLAGSILEAFLIDWLGSMHGKDYFNENYRVVNRWNKKEMKNAELIDFIDAIADILGVPAVPAEDKIAFIACSGSADDGNCMRRPRPRSRPAMRHAGNRHGCGFDSGGLHPPGSDPLPRRGGKPCLLGLRRQRGHEYGPRQGHIQGWGVLYSGSGAHQA